MLTTRCKKMIAGMLLSGLLLASMPMTAVAETGPVLSEKNQIEEVMPCLTYIVDSMADLSINGTTATVDCWVQGDYVSATKAKIIVELQLESGTDNWIAYGTWVDIQDGYEAYVYETKSVTKGQNYRVKVTATVWEGSQSETVTFFTDEMTA